MGQKYIDDKLYDAIVRFDDNEDAQEYFYNIMDKPSGKKAKDGHEETVREQILRIYGMLFCEDTSMTNAPYADVDDVSGTADRLYIGSVGYDSEHWYRMKHHFPVIDDDNFDRFAALVIADMNCGPMHDAALNDGNTLVVGEADPLHMTAEQRKNQKIKSVMI